MESKTRDLMNPEYMWDLTPMYANDELWEADLKEAEAMAKALGDIPGTLGASAESLKNGLDRIFAAQRKVEKVYIYAFLKKSGDNGNARYQEMEARCISLIVQLQTAAAFVNPEILAIDEAKLDEYMKDETLGVYRHMVEDIVRARAHTLDAKTEGILAMLGDAAQTPSHVFEMFESVDMRFPSIKDENGNEAPLTHGSFTVFRESKDARVRRDAFETYFGEFGKYINTLAAAYAGSVKQDCFFASVHNHASACESALFSNNVPLSLYDSLVSAVHDALPTMKDYLALRKKMLGVEELNMYDLYVPMLENADAEMPFDKGCEVVKEALKPLGETYQALLERAFKEKWIDVYENQGKTTGAYSIGVYDAHPYVLLNYTGTLDSQFTLAHEMGHALHSYLSNKHQNPIDAHYVIFVAEVASTCNEALLMEHLLSKTTDKKERMYLINHFLEQFKGTLYRQTMFAEFELNIGKMVAQGQTLTADALCAECRRLNEEYFGPDMVVDDQIAIEWARIPHFYYNYYVFQYATGYAAAIALSCRILHEGEKAVKDYLDFLSGGCSKSPIDLLKDAGVDMTGPEPVEAALELFYQLLDEMEELAGE